MAQVRGRVAETAGRRRALEIMDRMARRYTGKPFPLRSGIVYPGRAGARVSSMVLPFEHAG